MTQKRESAFRQSSTVVRITFPSLSASRMGRKNDNADIVFLLSSLLMTILFTRSLDTISHSSPYGHRCSFECKTLFVDYLLPITEQRYTSSVGVSVISGGLLDAAASISVSDVSCRGVNPALNVICTSSHRGLKPSP